MKSILTTLAFVICVNLLYSQVNKASIDNVVIGIKENMNSYKKVEELNEDNGKRFVYFNNDKLKLISVVSKENGYKKKVEWYFNDDYFFFGEQIWVTVNSQESTNNQKVYVDNNELIYFEKNNEVIAADNEEFKLTNAELKDYISKLKLRYSIN